MSDAKVGSAAVSDNSGARSQRRFARADVKISARYERADAPADINAEIRNLGGGGLRIASSEDLPREARLTVHFSLPAVDHEITVRGKVVMSFYDAGQSAYLHGIAFTQISRGDQEAIVTYVESIEHQASDRN